MFWYATCVDYKFVRRPFLQSQIHCDSLKSFRNRGPQKRGEERHLFILSFRARLPSFLPSISSAVNGQRGTTSAGGRAPRDQRGGQLSEGFIRQGREEVGYATLVILQGPGPGWTLGTGTLTPRCTFSLIGLANFLPSVEACIMFCTACRLQRRVDHPRLPFFTSRGQQ